MKKFFFIMLLMVVSIGASAQMQVWSKGTIVFSHNANDVDSISFAGGQMNVQVNQQAGGSGTLDLTNKVYSLSPESETVNYALCFSDNTNGYFVEQDYYSNVSWMQFTYSISGNTISFTSTKGTTTGVLINSNTIFINDISMLLQGNYSSTMPRCFYLWLK